MDSTVRAMPSKPLGALDEEIGKALAIREGGRCDSKTALRGLRGARSPPWRLLISLRISSSRSWAALV